MRRLLLVVLVACSHSSPPVKSAAAPSQCDQVADHLVSLMSASSTADPEQVDPWRRKIAQHCTQDLWTQKAQDCMLATKQLKDVDGCNTQLTQSQNESLMKELAPKPASPAESESIGAPGGGPPPPPPDDRKTRGPKKTGDPCEGGE